MKINIHLILHRDQLSNKMQNLNDLLHTWIWLNIPSCTRIWFHCTIHWSTSVDILWTPTSRGNHFSLTRFRPVVLNRCLTKVFQLVRIVRRIVRAGRRIFHGRSHHWWNGPCWRLGWSGSPHITTGHVSCRSSIVGWPVHKIDLIPKFQWVWTK